MDSTLAGYVRALRAAGAEASTAETLDAARAVALVGYAQRGDLKTVLGLALAKSAADRRIHDRVFDLYFGLPAVAVSPEDAAGPAAPIEDVQPAVPEQPTQPAALHALHRLAAGARPGADADRVQALQLALARAAAAAGLQDLQLFTQVAPATRRILQSLGMDTLDARLLQLLAADASGQHGAQQAEVHHLQATRNTLQRAARAWVDHAFELYGRPATENFMTDVAVHRTMGRMAPADLQRLQHAVARLARKLADRHARRQRVQRRGVLCMRRTLRANAGHDSVPWQLAFKHRRRSRPKVVAVCDVSGSVAPQVHFLLLFLYTLHKHMGPAMGGLQSFAFSSQLLHVSNALETLPFDAAMAHILKTAGPGSTDYGQAWAQLHSQHLHLVDRHTTLLVLGDGRSNGSNPQLDCFAELAQRAKRVVWLCPEPQSRWGTGDSALLRYQPWCTALTHCATVLDLERALDEALAAYS